MPDLFVEPTPPTTAATSGGAFTSSSLPLLAAECKNMDGIDGVSFVNQDPDEKIVLFLRRALITNLPWISVTLLGLALPVTFPYLLSQIAATVSLPSALGMALTAFYYLLLVGFAIYQVVSWFYNISIVSNKKVLDIDYARVTAKDVSTATLDSAEDVTYVQNGFIKTLFNFGNVNILTQSANSKIVFELVTRPSDVVATIIDLKQELLEK